jgi:hypothetical protein
MDSGMVLTALRLFVWLWLVALSALYAEKEPPRDYSPYNQNLPDCSKPFQRISKKSTAKAILCPMIR